MGGAIMELRKGKVVRIILSLVIAVISFNFSSQPKTIYSSTVSEEQNNTVNSYSTTPDWTVTGTEYLGQYAFISELGDVNGDGYDDVAIGSAPWSTSSLPGRVDVYYGSISGLSQTPSWSKTGDQAGAMFGFAMKAGDVNGDGYNDLLVGASQYDNGETNEGKAFLYLGSSTGLRSNPSWSFEGNSSSANLGGLLTSPSGDLNRDGYSDILVTSQGYLSGKGRVYAFYGSSSGLQENPAWTITGTQEGSAFGKAGIIGDINGDGYLDVGIGAENYDNGQTDEGKLDLYYGSASGLPANPSWTVEGNASGLHLGASVAPAGDVNGDGFADFAVSCYSSATITYVFHGSSSGPETIPDWTISPGVWPNAAGDLNHDGYDELIVGYPWSSNARGQAWIYPGSKDGLSSTYIWTDLGETEEDHYGWPLSTEGDINGDGANDLIVGAHAYPDYDIRYGRAYVYYGKPNYSGVIKDDHDNPWANVDILLGDGRTTKTNADGYYEFDVIASGELTVVPIRIDYRFAPLNGKVSWPDKPTQDFIIRPSTPEPFLGLPFDPNFSGYTEEQSFYIAISGNIDGTGESGKVNSWFDHDSPVYNYDTNSYLLRWDGQPLPNPNGNCSYGNSCYDGHDGVDFHEGQEILAAGDGDIVFAGWGCLGNHVIINHNNGYFTVYGHLRNTPAVSGHVYQGDVLGLAGSTFQSPCSSDGTHLHFAVYYDVNGNGSFDRNIDKVVDPFGWYPINSSLSDPWSTHSYYLWDYSNSAAFIATPAGTTQSSPTGFWTMQIPAGAVAEDLYLEILENPSVGPALVDYLFTGQNFLVRLQDGPTPQTEENNPSADNEVLELLVPATLTATYLPSQLPHLDLSNLAIFQWDDIGLTWTQLASTINTIDNTIYAQTSNFGQFTLQAPLVCSNAVNEPNDKYDVATYLVENSDLTFDNFDIETDEDWFRLRASRGNKYEISLSEIGIGVEVKFEFYDKDGVTLLFESNDPASIEWLAPDSGTYFIRVMRQSGGDFGCESTYSIELSATYYSFIPAIQR